MALTSSTVGGVVLLDVTVNWGVTIGVLCVDTTAEEVYPPTVACCGAIVGAVVTIKAPFCGASPAITMRIGVVACSNDIINLMGLVGVPLVP